MKTFYYTIIAAALLLSSCAKADPSEVSEEVEISKMVKATVVDGETTVTITTTENGETTTEVLTGTEAEAYLDDEQLNGEDHPAGSKVIVKKMDHDMSMNLDIDEILNSPELQDLDEETKAKIRTALEGAMGDLDFDINVEYSDDASGEPIVKTKVMVIDEE